MAHPKRATIIIESILGGMLFCAVLCVGLYVWSIGWPARPIVNPQENLCGMKHEQIQSALVYELPGTLFDRHTLCRLTPTADFDWPDKSGLGMDKVPQEFWSRTPYWWQPRRSTEAKFFMTSGFIANTRGPDGRYSLSMYDEEKKEIYIWLKDNF